MIFEFNGFNCKSKCEIDIFGRIVIATQMDHEDMPGTSVTNACEIIAKEVCDRYNVPYSELIFIEHYKKNGANEESYSVVEFEIKENSFHNPQWNRVDLETVADIIKTKSGYSRLDSFVRSNRKRLELDYNTRIAFLKAICEHEHFQVSHKDNKKYCYACGKLLE